MFKFSLFAAAATTILIAGPAGAADLRVFSPANPAIHISIVGKSTAQVREEIKVAATTVCGAPSGVCFSDAVQDADSQLSAITAARASKTAANTASAPNVEVARADPTTVHLSIKGKSRMVIEADIAAAARMVCTAAGMNAGEYNNCVSDAISDAKSQLQFVAQLDRPERLAAN
jgi:hypothetical protein